MSHLANPENALKRVEGLLDVGQVEPALEFLVRTMDSKRYKSQWSKTVEDIAIKVRKFNNLIEQDGGGYCDQGEDWNFNN
jgi:hypothetical protein